MPTGEREGGRAERVSTRRFLAALLAMGRGRFLVTLGLVTLQGLVEGFGLLALVPLLLLVDGGGQAPPAGAAALVGRGLETLGLPLELLPVLLVFVGVMALRSLLMSRASLALVRIQLEFVLKLRTGLFSALARAEWPFLVRRRLSDIVQTVAQDVMRVSNGTRDALDLVATGILSVVYLALAVHLSLPATAIVLGVGLVLEALRWPLVKRARELGESTTTIHREAFLVVSEFVNGLKPIKARALDRRHADRYAEAITRVQDQRLEVARAALRAQAVNQTAVAVVLAVALIVSISSFDLPRSALILLIVVFARAMPLFSRLHRDVRGVAQMLPAYQAAHELQAELEAAAEPADDGSWSPTLDRELRMEAVSFDYALENGRQALSDIELRIPARTTVGVIGPSGAGKSTLVDCLLGLLVPSEGRVLVDGQTLDPARGRAWRRHVGYVPQDTFLFHDTIRANLSWTSEETKEEELWEALRRAAADELVRGLPEGLDTVVGDRGARLSGGERQRIALARALLSRPALLVLDEATSQVDAATEAQIRRALRELHGSTTIVVVAHRPALVMDADQVVLLEEGRVAEQGPATELVRREDSRLRRWMRELELGRLPGAGGGD